MNKVSIRFFNDREIRAVWDDAAAKWWFSVLDVVGALNGEPDYAKTRNYWKYLKAKLKRENSELVSATTQLKLTAADGKRYKSDALDADGIVALAKAMPNNRAAAFLDWFLYSDNTIDELFRVTTLFKVILMSLFLLCQMKFVKSLLKSIQLSFIGAFNVLDDFLQTGNYICLSSVNRF